MDIVLEGCSLSALADSSSQVNMMMLEFVGVQGYLGYQDYPEVALTLETGPTMRWVGPETLVDIVLEGSGLLALAESGSQVNMMTLEFMQAQGYPVLPLNKLVDYPLHLVGLGSQHTCPLGFVIARLQVKEVAGYDEDVVFLVVPDELAFRRRVPLVIGTCTLGCIINVIKESELN